MTTKEEIIQTLQDCECELLGIECIPLIGISIDQTGKNGFEKAHTWKSVIGNR